MKIDEAKNIMVGEQIISKKTGIIGEVISISEFIPATGGNTIIYIRCKVGNCLMKFSHKEVDLFRQ